TKIYEACTFQDLTGQRVNKVIKILKEVDARIARMLQLFGGDAAVTALPRRDERTGDERLLNGPQLPDQAPSQDDIDALFANGKP
ncbi:MAG: protein phosphatase CheZ, partial [Alphaproteobacteria bacterium]|nr:protein phosphatase CheZ [Alphaproteobacteria bacterium]